MDDKAFPVVKVCKATTTRWDGSRMQLNGLKGNKRDVGSHRSNCSTQPSLPAISTQRKCESFRKYFNQTSNKKQILDEGKRKFLFTSSMSEGDRNRHRSFRH